MTDILEQARALVDDSCEWRDLCKQNVAFDEPCECRKRAAAILALAEPKWREIDSAPKDGTFVILCDPEPGIESIAWASWQSDTWYGVDEEGLTYDLVCRKSRPTHWRSIPLPPKEEQ